MWRSGEGKTLASIQGLVISRIKGKGGDELDGAWKIFIVVEVV